MNSSTAGTNETKPQAAPGDPERHLRTRVDYALKALMAATSALNCCAATAALALAAPVLGGVDRYAEMAATASDSLVGAVLPFTVKDAAAAVVLRLE